ncbi:hypothetical protein Emag_002537 [Eimeria magna]
MEIGSPSRVAEGGSSSVNNSSTSNPPSSSSNMGVNSSGSSSSSSSPRSSSNSSSISGRQQPQDMWAILSHAKSQAFKGGVAGASAQVLNVLTFMWLRTTMNYQYRHGGSALTVMRQLWNEGGIPRFYRGLLPALLQSPLSRFGDTASNVGILSFLDSTEQTRNLPVGIKTALASCGAAGWRLFLMPIDAWKTTKQVEGGDGLKHLTAKGAAAAATAITAATAVAATVLAAAAAIRAATAAAATVLAAAAVAAAEGATTAAGQAALTVSDSSSSCVGSIHNSSSSSTETAAAEVLVSCRLI